MAPSVFRAGVHSSVTPSNTACLMITDTQQEPPSWGWEGGCVQFGGFHSALVNYSGNR